MGLAIRLELSADCDECSRNLMLDDLDVQGRPTRKKLLTEFARYKWRKVDGRMLCPDCQSKINQPRDVPPSS